MLATFFLYSSSGILGSSAEISCHASQIAIAAIIGVAAFLKNFEIVPPPPGVVGLAPPGVAGAEGLNCPALGLPVLSSIDPFGYLS